MPKELHDRLAKEADKQGLVGEARDRFIFGTMQKILNARKNTANTHDSEKAT